jgi:hypothetical protein
LHRIGSEMFPELDRRLAALRGQRADAQAAAPLRTAAQDQIDSIIAQMQLVLSRMLELETFNEALAMLRSIIESQDRLNQATEDARRAGVLEE